MDHSPGHPPHRADPAAPTARTPALRRLLPLVVLAAGFAAFFAFGLHRYITFDQLRDHHHALQAQVAEHRVLAPLCYAAVYAVAVAFSLPVGLVMTIAGGFLFGTLVATAATTVGATLGATAVFVAARTALAGLFRGRVAASLARFEEGFRRNAFSYMLVLRLVPIFPFWLVNIAPAFTSIRRATYMLATFIGIIPGTLVYASVGSGLGAVFEAGGTPDLGIIFSPEILLPIAGLALLALVPVAYQRLRRQRR